MVENESNEAIDASELALLQQNESQRGKLLADRGVIGRQMRHLEQQLDHLDAELDQLDRQHLAFSNRLTEKYNLPPNARVDVSTGAISR